MPKNGLFISIEGPDGSGKSSAIQGLATRLSQDGFDLVLTREPGGSPIAEQIRQVILDVNNTAMDPMTEALLYAAGRRQHLKDTILPALAAGKVVISDRFVDSSLAYQGVGRNLSQTDIWNINQYAIQGHLPDITLLLDVPAEVGLKRIYQARNQRQFDRLDQEDLSFHNKVRQAFLDLAADQDRIHVIDARQAVDQVVEDAFQVLKSSGLLY
ncbi:dTMP kinase [Eremococcus coleocola]|uniref:Thymidylate kinase n=1 Tax=Eremococcus coleocola ACS-139-V-Col8 TaxID=908337 RepID=E4KR12_9LACT|nr:dTMP kinase [Eremococcus coleocola]EFR30727.1 dTMP kinase [Eremococcus coleocola ACS-139-V-Col8]